MGVTFLLRARLPRHASNSNQQVTKLINPSTKALHSFLNDKNGLVVHFSGCPKGIGPGKELFPDDLKDILSGRITGALSCSVVIPGDFYSSEPDKGHATGTIEVILNVEGSNLSAVGHCDAGSYVDDDGNRHVPEKDITINPWMGFLIPRWKSIL